MPNHMKILLAVALNILAVLGGGVTSSLAAPAEVGGVTPESAAMAPLLQTTTPISGTVFLDFNGDGFRSTVSQNPYAITTPASVVGSTTSGLWPLDPGVPGITVTAYISGTMAPAATTATEANGVYTLSLEVGRAYQIVFSGYQNLGYTEGPLGRLTVTGSGASAQVEPSAYTNNSVTVEPSVGNGFVIVNLTGGAALNGKVHFGLVKAELYSNVVPRVAWSEATEGSTASSVSTSYRWPVMNSWTGGTDLWDQVSARVDRDKVGTVWGLAYQNISDLLFASSVLRRHTPALASDPRSDTIFLIDNNSASDPNGNAGTATLLGQVSLSTLGINTGDVITRTPWIGNDADAFALVGKRGIGGIDLTTSGYNSTLYLANLTDRKVYGLKVGVPATTTLGAGSVVELPAAPWITGDPCNGLGPARPWAVKVYEDNLYVGLVCTGENAPRRSLYINAGADTAASGWITDTGKYTAVVPKVAAVALTKRGTHTCILTDRGSVKCWGKNGEGQLGNGTTTDQTKPTVYVPGLGDGVKQLSTGGNTTCVVTATNGVKCWGRNAFSQLGDGSTTNSSYPVQVSGLISGVTSIAVGAEHACAVQNGAVKCWGYNGNGQLGDGTTTNRTTLVTAIVSGTVSVSAGEYNTCALMADTTVRCWGYAGDGANGNGSTSGGLSPVTVQLASNSQNLTGATQVVVGGAGACALMNDSKVMCWGHNGGGQVGDGSNTQRNRAVYVTDSTAGNADLTGITSLSGGERYSTGHFCALTNAGTVKCWGRNADGQIGDGTTADKNRAVAVPGLTGVAGIGSGSNWSCAVLDDGTLKCWGSNSDGQLGDGTYVGRSTPASTLPIHTPLTFSGQPVPYDTARLGGSNVLTYSVPYTNGTYELGLFFYRTSLTATLSIKVEGQTSSLVVPGNTQTVHRQTVTLSDGKLDVVVDGNADLAFLNGLTLGEPPFAGRALVYAYPLASDGTPDVSAGITWTLPISVPLNYARSAQINDDACAALGIGTRKSAGWNAWADSYNDVWHSSVTSTTGCGPVGRRMAAWPQPMLVDIEFGPGGKIALGFADRFAYQMATSGDARVNNSTTDYAAQPHPPGSADTSGTGYYSTDYAGDVLCASGTGTGNNGWRLEPAGLCSGGGATGNNGSATEFFADSFTDENSIRRWEPARGALYTIPGAPSLAVHTSYIKTGYDYYEGATAYGWTGGTSLRSQGGIIADHPSVMGLPGTVLSGNGAHDYELLSVPAPVEIGNRVWHDLNANGIQDPGEPGLAGVVVKLTDAGGNVAQATTDAAGYFLFSSDADPTPTDVRKNSSSSRIYGLDGRSSGEVNLLPVSASPFTMTVALNQSALFVGPEQMYPTVEYAKTETDPSGPGAIDNDPRDSNATFEIAGGEGVSAIRFNVGRPGTNDSAYDFGFVLPVLMVGNKVWQDANNNGFVDSGESGIAGVAVELYADADGSNVFTPGVDKHLMSTTTDSTGAYTFIKAPPGNLLVVITDTNFIQGGALYNKLPVKTLGFTPADGNGNRNAVSHGTRYGVLGSGGYVASNVVTLSAGREPDTAADGDDKFGNLTIDFGFINATVCTVGSGDVGGSLFIDNDFSGSMGATEELLPVGVIISAYDAQNSVVLSATVGQDGRYVLPGLYSRRPATETLRFEFTNLPDGFGTGSDGSYDVAGGAPVTGSGTSIQFRSGATCNLNYGVSDLFSSSCSSSYLAQCAMYGGAYNDGNPLSAGSDAAVGDFVVSYQYGATGFRTGGYLAEAKGADVGAVWGMASNKPQGSLLVSATIKRSVQLGPLGLGGIYRMTLQGTDTPEQFINLTTLGIDVGAANIPSNAVRSADHDDPLVVANWVGRAGMGDIDLNMTGHTLWVTNLYNKKLIAINVAGKTAITGTNPVTVTDILTQTAIPMPQCALYQPTVGVTTTVASGEGRPWGIAVRKDFDSGKEYVYAGVVCDASVSLNRQHLSAAIYRYDVGASTWLTTPLVSFPLNYQKPDLSPDTVVTFDAESDGGDRYFQPWLPMALNIRAYQQPILADIDFDDDSSIVVQIIDRSAHQRTPYQRDPIPSEFTSGGDTLRFCKVDDDYVAQGLDGCPLIKRNGQGLNGGQFYWGIYTDPAHYNTQTGGIAIMEGTRQVAVGVMDPNQTFFTQGTTYVSSLTGNRGMRGYVTAPMFGDGTFAKGSGLGDMEVICEPPPLEIGNRIWLDPNRNGIQDANETPLTNLTVKLYSVGPDGKWNTTDDVLVATTTTNSRGEYIFKDSTDGNIDRDIYSFTVYQVRVDTTQTDLLPYVLTKRNAQMGLSILVDESDRNNYADLRDSDAAMVGTDAVIQLTTSAYRDNNHTYDIGFYPVPASIGNYVWFDTNRDGLQGATETGVPGVVVELRDVNSTVVATTTTNANGYYLFDNLDPADYSLKFSPPAGYSISPQNAGTNDAVDSNVDPATGTTVNTTLVAGENDPTWDLGIYLPVAPASLGDRVWFDTDKDGIQDTGETGVNGVEVKLYRADGTLVATTMTDAGGNYLFPNLVPGDYYVEFAPPAGYSISPQNIGSNDGADSDVDPTTRRTATTTLVSGENDLTWDLGLFVPTQPASIGNRVWFDTDQDGIQDAGEASVANVKVELYNSADQVVGTLYTDSSGNYNFTNLPPGDYYVRFYPPSGYTVSPQDANGAAGNEQTTGGADDSDVDPVTGETAYTTLVAGENDPTWDMGIYLAVQPASIGDRIWYDTDKDGIQDAGETTNVAGVTVILYNGDGSVRATTVTTETGAWRFDNLAPGDYYVQFYPPAGYEISPQNAGSDAVRSSGDPVTGLTISTTLAAGEVDLTWDLGLYELPAQFGDRVWVESDTDGLAATGVITPVAGMVITATASGGAVYTATTDAGGYYSFTVPAGTYTVTYGSVPASYGAVLPSGTPGGNSASGSAGGYQQSGNPDQSHANNTTVTVGAGEANWTVDFAFNKSSGPSAQFGDRVWIESDTDGLAATGVITPVAGMVITATASGGAVYTATTDAGGYYSFTVPAGTYTVTYGSVPASYGTLLPSGTPGGSSESGNEGSYQQSGNPDQSHANNTTVTVAAGEANWTIDFAFTVPLASLGDRVWYDTDQDGIQDASETGVAGVTVNLLGASGAVVATTVTDANGYYRFANLAPGAYAVQFVPPSGYTISPQDQGSDDSIDSDANPLTGKTIVTTLVTGENDPTWDLGIYLPVVPARLGDFVWWDLDQDGIQDASEAGVPGITVHLYGRNGNLIATTTTAADGRYVFSNLAPGDYYVEFTAPDGVIISPQNQGTDDTADSDVDPTTGRTPVTTLVAGENDPTWDLGLYESASLGDRVWYDADKDGVQDAAEIGVAGVKVELYDENGVLVATTTTNKDGYYHFVSLAPGDYAVKFYPPSGYTISPQDAGNDDSVDSDVNPLTGKTVVTTLVAGENDPTWDLGLYLPEAPASLGNRVWYDTDKDGVQDASETGLAGVTVNLLDASGAVVATTVTDAKGYYRFANLAPGDYAVQFVPPSGYTISPQDQGSNDSVDSDVNPLTGKTVVTTLAAGENDPTWDLGLYLPVEPASLGDRVWYDTDKDGIQDASETSVAGVTVNLLDASGAVVATTVTDAKGYYRFANLAPGDYAVQFVPPSGYTISPQDQGSDDSVDSDVNPLTGKTVVTTLVAGENDPTWDLGLYLPVEPASLGDRVWYDTDKDGVQDAGETGVAGVTVNLLGASGAVVATTVTDADGDYRFANLAPGDYAVQFVPPSGYTISPQDAGSDDSADSDANPLTGKTVVTTLVAGENDPTWDLGLYLPVAPAALGDYVWYDSNRNGVQDVGETGVPGVTVQLYSADGVLLAEQVTNSAGHYLFDNLPAGDYLVKFIPPAGYQLSPQVAIADFADSDADPQTGWSHPITLAAGELDPTIDAGIFLPTPPAAIGNRVWFDTDKDGAQGDGEPGVAGVAVTLYREDGSQVASMVTGADGLYLFENLAPGNYYVGFAPPPAYSITTQDALGETGNDQSNGGAEDSDASAVTGLTAVTNLVAGERDLTWDLGLTLPVEPASLGDYVWIDLDADGVQDVGEPPLEGGMVTLYSADGAVLGVTKTDANGYYHFGGLPPGSYSVGFTPPAGYTPSPADSGEDAADSDASPITGWTSVVTLDAGEHDPTLDAGFVPLLSLGNLVFNDFRNNGIFDPAEDYGIPGIVMNLLDTNGNLLATTTTDANGHYLFTNLTPGDYMVEIAQSNFAAGGKLEYFVSSLTGPAGDPQVDPDNDVNNDDNGSGVNLPGGGRLIRSLPVTLAYNSEPTNDEDLNPMSNLSLDFGVYDPALGDLVWIDADRDGIQDVNEVGVPGVQMDLYVDIDNDGDLELYATTTTDANGNYLFTFLPPGDYVVKIPARNFAPGGALYGYTLTVGGDDPDDDDNTDSNGLDDGAGGVTTLAVTLTSGGEPTNDGDDNEFTNLSMDFGFWINANIGDHVWYDTDQDGIQDASETGVPGVTVYLLDAGGNVIASTVTNGQGYYRFEDIPPGDYAVQFAPPAGYSISPQDVGGNDGADSDADPATLRTILTTLVAGENDPTWDLGIYLPVVPAAIGDRVWYDADKDGIQDVGETGVAGVTVQLLDSSGAVLATTTTDAEGDYLFANLPPGDYRVKFIPPAGYVITAQDAGGANGNDQSANGGASDSDVDPATGLTVVTNLSAGETDRTWDLGLYLATPPAAIGDRVWYDTNRDGLQNAGEGGVPGVIVQLYTAAGVLVGEQRTDAQGDYLFQNLPAGDYYVQFIPPTGYVITAQDAGGTNGNDQSANGGIFDSDVDPLTGRTVVTNLQPGETDRTWDAGLYLATPPASIGDRVWYDADRDGVQDFNETGVAGVTVELRNEAGVLVATTMTDVGGYYRFENLVPGEYAVNFILPGGYLISPQDAGSNDSADSDVDPANGRAPVTVLVAGENDPTWDLGIYLPVEPASLGDRVWYDTDKDGAQDEGETGVAGVRVQLYDATGRLIAETLTDESGNYRFNNLVPGDYYVQFVPPPSYSISPQDATGNDWSDSDVNPLTGQTVVTTLVAGENDPTWDLGLSLPVQPASLGDRVWFDTDRDGIQDTGETGVAGVLVQLYDAAGNLVAETVTDANGNYLFANLVPGDYQLRFTPPAGYTITNLGNGGSSDSDVDPLTGTTTTISLDPGENDLTWDMGLHLMGAVPTSLGSYVWFDVDQDGVQDAGETGAAGVVVRLYDTAGKLIAETVTDANGGYLFGNLAPGEYYVQFIPPYSYVISGQNLGGAADDSDGSPVKGWTAVVNLQAGENDPTWDLGIYQYAPTALPEESEPVMDVRFYLPLVSSHYPLDAAAESVLVPEGTAAPEWVVQLYLPAVQSDGFALATAEEGALSAPALEGTAPVTPTLEATP